MTAQKQREEKEEIQVFQGSFVEIIKKLIDSDNPNKAAALSLVSFVAKEFASLDSKAIVIVPIKYERWFSVWGAIKHNNKIVMFESYDTEPEENVLLEMNIDLLKKLLEE